MSTIRTNLWAADANGEALRARVGQAGATSQAQATKVSISEQSIEKIAASAAASVVYRQLQSEVSDDQTYDYMATIKFYKKPILPDINAGNEAMNDANIKAQSLGNIFEEFKKTLKTIAPDLASLNFGFTLDGDGSLLVTSGKSIISVDQKHRLNQFLNQFDKLKNGAQEFAKNIFAYVKLENDFGLGLSKFDAKNFKDIIDIGEAIDFHKTEKDARYQLTWFMQLHINTKIDLERKKEFNTPISVQYLKMSRVGAPDLNAPTV